MEGKTNNLCFFFFLTFLAVLPTFRANNGEFDEVWQKKARDARAAANAAYQPNPEEVTEQINHEVRSSLKSNGTRRSMRSKKGPCLATNPIDRCWRCKQDWASNRKRLAKCALGFGRKTTGGLDGEFYVVNDPSDNDLVNPKKGTLRHAVIQVEPLWIIFARDMVIRLNEELIMNGNKTIDARGQMIHIAYGAGITVQFVSNVIIHGLRIHDIKAGSGGMIRSSTDHYGFRTRSDGDGISIFGSSHVWLDHLSMSKCTDGLIDVIMASTAVTISNCHFTHHNEAMLMGASDSHTQDYIMQVTIAFNHFGQGIVQRMPRCRYGFFHVLNNDYTHWIMYAMGGSKNPTILSQGNRFIAPNIPFAKEVTKREYAPEQVWKDWTWTSEGDLLMNGAFFTESGKTNSKRNFSRHDVIKAKPGSFVSRLTRFAGSLTCKKDVPC